MNHIDYLAQEIRRVDGNHDLGAGALAEALWPYISDLISDAARIGFEAGKMGGL